MSTPLLIFHWNGLISVRTVPFLTWAGIHGGISIALALSLPANNHRPVILATTYAEVPSTLIVQGPTLSWVARRTLKLEAGSWHRCRQHLTADAPFRFADEHQIQPTHVATAFSQLGKRDHISSLFTQCTLTYK